MRLRLVTRLSAQSQNSFWSRGRIEGRGADSLFWRMMRFYGQTLVTILREIISFMVGQKVVQDLALLALPCISPGGDDNVLCKTQSFGRKDQRG